MTDSTIAQNQIDSKPFDDFSDWLVPTIVGTTREEYPFRWKTMERLFITSCLEDEQLGIWLSNLITASVETSNAPPDVLIRLRAEIKADDPMYSNSSDKGVEEARNLASYGLRLILDDEIWQTEICSVVATKILAASFDGMRTFKGGVDLYTLAKDTNHRLVRSLRDKKCVSVSKLSLLEFSKSLEENISRLTDENEAVDTDDIKDISLILVKSVKSQINKINELSAALSSNVQKENNKTAEELEVLWFVTTAWSEILEKPYSDLSTTQKVVDFAVSLSNRTYIQAELPSLQALAHKLEITNEIVTFEDFVEETVSYEGLNKLDFDEINTSTPYLFALKLKRIGAWKKKWEQDTGLSTKIDINAQNLAVQVYRELLSVNWDDSL